MTTDSRTLSERADELALELEQAGERGMMAAAGALQARAPEILQLLRELAHAVDRLEASNGR